MFSGYEYGLHMTVCAYNSNRGGLGKGGQVTTATTGEWADGHTSYQYPLLDLILLLRAVGLLGVVI